MSNAHVTRPSATAPAAAPVPTPVDVVTPWLYTGLSPHQYQATATHRPIRWRYANGDLYTGDWSLAARCIDGQGIHWSVVHGKWEGTWRNGKRNGPGVHTSKAGVVTRGVWRDDVLDPAATVAGAAGAAAVPPAAAAPTPAPVAAAPAASQPPAASSAAPAGTAAPPTTAGAPPAAGTTTTSPPAAGNDEKKRQLPPVKPPGSTSGGAALALQDMSVDDVGALLVEAGLPQYVQLFKARGVDGPLLRMMGESDLVALGVKDVEHARKIVLKILFRHRRAGGGGAGGAGGGGAGNGNGQPRRGSGGGAAKAQQLLGAGVPVGAVTNAGGAATAGARAAAAGAVSTANKARPMDDSALPGGGAGGGTAKGDIRSQKAAVLAQVVADIADRGGDPTNFNPFDDDGPGSGAASSSSRAAAYEVKPSSAIPGPSGAGTGIVQSKALPQLKGTGVQHWSYRKDVQLLEKVDTPEWGAVHCAQVPGDALASVKVMRSAYDEQFNAELAFLLPLRHPRIAPLLGVTNDQQSALIFRHFADGTAASALIKEKRLSDAPTNAATRARVVQIAADVAEALVFLHTGVVAGAAAAPAGHVPVTHGALCARHVLLDDAWRAYVADFGRVRQVHNQLTFGYAYALTAEPMTWNAPEVLRAEAAYAQHRAKPGQPVRPPLKELAAHAAATYTPAADVWCFGVLLWQLFARAVPFASVTGGAAALVQHLETAQPPLLPAPEWVSPALRDLMAQCWRTAPTERPTMAAVLATLQNELKAPGTAAPAAAPSSVSSKPASTQASTAAATTTTAVGATGGGGAAPAAVAAALAKGKPASKLA